VLDADQRAVLALEQRDVLLRVAAQEPLQRKHSAGPLIDYPVDTTHPAFGEAALDAVAPSDQRDGRSRWRRRSFEPRPLRAARLCALETHCAMLSLFVAVPIRYVGPSASVRMCR